MFHRQTSTVPLFSVTFAEITKDIEEVCKDASQKNKLYQCLDQKPIQEHLFLKIEDFLHGMESLENTADNLNEIICKLENLNEMVQESVKKLSQSEKLQK